MSTPPEHPAKHDQPPVSPKHDDLGFDLPPPARVSATRMLALAAVAAAVLAAAFVLSWLPRRRARHELQASSERVDKAPTRVQVISLKPRPSDHKLSLPGSVQALEETTVYPRASGYLHRWHVDIGDHVAEGALLAEIDTPELDQQIAQARAQLVQAEASLSQAKANRELARANLERYKQLAPKGVSSQQELDQAQARSLIEDANVKVADAAIEAQRANVRRLSQLKSFARVVAPFGGTINARTIERGALVSPTTPLFKLSSTDPVRVFVQIPQGYAPAVRVDVAAQVSVREYAGRTFEGKISRSSHDLDPASRTMNTEIRVPNPGGELLAGMYAQVSLTLPSSHPVLELPATALLNDARGVRVAVVDASSVVHLVPVTIERDTGATIELASGLDGSERVVKLASAELSEGQKVEVLP